MSHMTTSNVCPHVFPTVNLLSIVFRQRVQILTCLRHQMVADLLQPRLRKGWVWTVWVLSKSFRSSMHPEMSLAWHTSWWPNFVLQYISTNSDRLPDRLRWCWHNFYFLRAVCLMSTTDDIPFSFESVNILTVDAVKMPHVGCGQ